jgi:phosphosulfolactate phosphohydrolase-like enzyme
MLRSCDHGRALAAAGLEADLVACAAIDTHAVVPVLQDRQLVRHDALRGR